MCYLFRGRKQQQSYTLGIVMRSAIPLACVSVTLISTDC